MLLLSGCIYVWMTQLSKEDLEWVKCGKTYKDLNIKFFSNLGDSATLTYKYWFIKNYDDPIVISGRRELFEIFEAIAGYDFEIKNDVGIYNGSFRITSLAGKDSLHVSARISNFFLPLKRDYIPLKAESFTIDDIVFKDCLIADSLNAGYGKRPYETPPDIRIDKFVISKKHGLIYYRFENGEEFTPKFKQNPAQ